MARPCAWHALAAEEVLGRLGVDPDSGLDDAEAARRLGAEGPNEIPGRGGKSPWAILRDQFVSVLMALLAGAACVSFALGERIDAAAILAILVLNALVGFRQEYRAEKAMAALSRLAVPEARILRGGRRLTVPSRELVPGDVVFLDPGFAVPADCRILSGFGLATQEAALTGESAPVDKETRPVPGETTPLTERWNMAFMGTVVVRGRGEAVVTGTGMATALGSVAGMLQAVGRDPTPLQRRLARLGRGLSLAALALVGVVAGLGILRGEEPRILFLTAVSLAVAAIPEGLPAVVTITLALGAERMLARRALVRRLPSVETLGSVTVICTDKTGTLTMNRMTVAVVETDGELLRLDRAGSFEGHGSGMPAAVASMSPPCLLLAAGALCGDAALGKGEGAAPAATGDPTEVALVAAAARLGLDRNDLETRFPRAAEVPFDSVRRRMVTVHEAVRREDAGPGGARHIGFAKGAVDSLLDISSAVLTRSGPVPLTAERRDGIVAAGDRMAREGMRVLGVAYRTFGLLPDGGRPEDLEADFIFLGLAGLIDPPRPEARPAVDLCRGAGIRPVMITGDHPLTALAVARGAGLDAGGGALTGREIDALGDAELGSALERVSVYARVAPEHKLRIVETLKRRGQVVAMTGDGVNDAPALKKADIGVAMGLAGTDVAKEAADMVLMDDNFATIVAAVLEGRAIEDNIRKFVRYVLASNAGEILVMILAPFLGMPLPLLPLQILWVNLVTDGLPALALAVEPAGRDVMRRPPRPPGEHILGGTMVTDILVGGAAIGIVSLAAASWAFGEGSPGWRTMTFTTLTFAQMANVMSVRAGSDFLFRAGIASNRPLLGAVALTAALQVAIVYVPPLAAVFRTVPLSAREMAASVAVSLAVFAGLEIRKAVGRRI